MKAAKTSPPSRMRLSRNSYGCDGVRRCRDGPVGGVDLGALVVHDPGQGGQQVDVALGVRLVAAHLHVLDEVLAVRVERVAGVDDAEERGQRAVDVTAVDRVLALVVRVDREPLDALGVQLGVVEEDRGGHHADHAVQVLVPEAVLGEQERVEHRADEVVLDPLLVPLGPAQVVAVELVVHRFGRADDLSGDQRLVERDAGVDVGVGEVLVLGRVEAGPRADHVQRVGAVDLRRR